MVFWVLILCRDVVGYQHFGGPCCLHLQGEVNGALESAQKTMTGAYILCGEGECTPTPENLKVKGRKIKEQVK
jgi:hypothetical protein